MVAASLGDQLVNDATIGNLIDKNLETSWSTEAYKSPSIAGAIYPNKTGVGFNFSLAEEATLIRLSYTLTGWAGQLQVRTTDGTYVSVAPLGEGPDVYLSQPISAGRVWFTTLAPLPDSDEVIVNVTSEESVQAAIATVMAKATARETANVGCIGTMSSSRPGGTSNTPPSTG